MFDSSLLQNGFRRGRLSLYALVFLISVVPLACNPGKQPEATAQAKRYELKGKVVSVDKEKKEVTIAHDEIKGYMPAMTMPFKLKDEWAFDVLAPGSRVGATLVVDANSFWLEGIAISMTMDDPTGVKNPMDTVTKPKLGDEVPDFSLINQDGKPVKLHQYRGKALLLTFIYTRCPLPEYCTLMSSNLNEVNKALQGATNMQERTHLLSITIDPEYDTPKVLRSYGAATTGKFAQENFAHWDFVTGKPEEIKRTAEYFGLTYFEEKNQITHSLRTALIAPDGKVHKLYPGNEWNPADVFKDIQNLLGNGDQKEQEKK